MYAYPVNTIFPTQLSSIIIWMSNIVSSSQWVILNFDLSFLIKL